MAAQVYYEDIEEDTELPNLLKQPTTRQLVKWAGASGDYYEVHYDKDFAQSKGFPGVIVHGRLKASFLGQLLTDWIGTEGRLKKLTCRYIDIDQPGENLICKGKVSKKYERNDEHIVECEVWIEGSGGRKTTLGSGVVILPSRR